MNKSHFWQALIIVTVTVLVLVTGYFLGAERQPRVIFHNGGEINSY